LASLGYGVTVFEREKEPGGMLRYGIPAYRLPREVLAAEIWRILTSGITLVTGCEIRRDKSLSEVMPQLRGEKNADELVSARCRPILRIGDPDPDAGSQTRPTPPVTEVIFSELRQEFNAVLVATGAHRSKKIAIEGMEKASIHDGVELLKRIARGERVATGKSPIVIGGGNVAVDVARSLKRLGAETVKIACLESHRLMPAHLWEVKDALEEGIELFTSVGPQAIVSKDGKIEGLSCVACRTTFDEEGRFRPDLAAARATVIPGDAIVLAIGQEAETTCLDGACAFEGKRPVVDPVTLALSEPGVFAAGDLVLGAASAIEAIGQGHEAALSIDRYLLKEDLSAGRGAKDAEGAPLPSRPYQRLSRKSAKKIIPSTRAKSFAEYEERLSEEEAVAEASRCLNCSVCSECKRCVEACGRDAVVHEMEDRLEEIAVGAVILAPGYRHYDPSRSPEYGWGRLPNVLTSPQFERLLSASGPTGGKLFRPSDKQEPKRVAFIQCVGSREEKEGNRYCSAVCCMYAIKEAVIA
ncbi:MAG: FAD-dependent oxidoreductase, partial [Candidatus Aureabacteria bacterium]|nr:FAD-dependent oxidoreductase [Candidatus Auribacterota bacterium]